MSVRRVVPLPPGEHRFATPDLPPSKSDLNRRLVLAALLPGETRVGPRSEADDVVRLVEGLRALGVTVRDEPHGWTVGTLDLTDTAARMVDAGEGGTTSRFLLALASRRAGPTEVRGAASLARRPVEPLLSALRSLGASVERLPGPELVVRVCGPWRASAVEVAADETSQFASALMLVAPPAGLDLTLGGEPVSRPYVALTLRALLDAGGAFDGDAATLHVTGGSRPVAFLPAAPDVSSACWPMALAALRGRVTVPPPDPGQSDARFPQLLAAMGARIESVAEGPLHVRASPLRGIEVDARDCPDLVPALCAVAAAATGETVVRGAAHLRAKESDRIAGVVALLAAFGVTAEPLPDGLRVHGLGDPALLAPDAAPPVLGDHRLAMAAAILGRAGNGAWIETPECVAKSWPGFWSWLEGV